MNTNFGHFNENNNLIYAEDYALVDGIKYMNPTGDMYAKCNPPELPIE